MNELKLTIPLVPPDLNHYVRHTRRGRHYITAESKAFKEAVAIISAGKMVIGRRFDVEAIIYLGHKKKGDVDGFGKLILDALAYALVFQKANLRRPLVATKPLSDAHVTDFTIRKRRDITNPRTEITVRAI